MAMAKLRVLSDDEKDGVDANAPVSVNRIRHVREQQGVSLRTAARRMNKDIRSIRSEEDEDSDLRISQLKRWQEVLDVPMIDLLQEPGGPLSRPVLERAKLLRIMKTAVSIAENATEEPIQRFAQMLREQLIDLMPELEEVPGWHSIGQRRGLDEMGRIAEHPVMDSHLGSGNYVD
ncbi:helix-turn-helix domain-containing protein [Pirellulaceae bacterium]|jgi:transcriptional regulator with XRE-family HTH domain|nr:helix-turn-helix domain-containing protein [Pirellulaceae bacterium]